jgi:molybdenum ABC transporter, periplasmic molybdate-binding protein
MKRSKRLVSLFCAAALLISSMAACTTAGTENGAESGAGSSAVSSGAASASSTPLTGELNISAAASLTESLNAIGKLYQQSHPDVKLTFNFAASGTLQTQIEEGAPADLFLSAAPKQMKALTDKGLILTDTEKDLLVNTIVLIVPANSTLGLSSFEDCLTDKVKTVALGEPESVPCGQYAQQIFTKLNGWDKIKAKTSFGSDVKQVLSWVETGNTDCGVVYATDVVSAADKVKTVCEAPEGTYDKVVYPAALVKATKNRELAQSFLDYLSSGDAKTVFEKNGFTMA